MFSLPPTHRLATYALAACVSLPALAQESLHIIPIGDSITQGGKSGTKEFTYRWPLLRMLHDEGVCFDFIGSRRAGLDPTARWPQSWDDNHEGYYGAKTSTVRDRLVTSLPTLPAPDIALVDLGTNDQGASVDRAVIAPMTEIVALLRKQNPRVRVLIGQIPASLLWGMYLHLRITQLAADLSTPASPVVAVDQHSGWSVKENTFDGVHPNLVGQRWMAERWLAAMRPYLPPSQEGCETGDRTSARR